MLLATCCHGAYRRLLQPLTVAVTRGNSSLTPSMSSERQHAAPRPSASLIVIDRQNRVLMVERNPNSKSFAGAYVRSTHGLIHTCAHIYTGIPWRKL